MTERHGGRAQQALRELVAESIESGCCTAGVLCAKHERIDAQVAHARAKKAVQNARIHGDSAVEIAVLEAEQARQAERYRQATAREHIEEMQAMEEIHHDD